MKCVDLFCGCGGMSLGFANAGFDIVASFDNWDKAISVYKDNFSHPAELHDLSNETKSIEKINHYDPDIIIGGPPCQDFSSAGHRDESLGRADLTYNYANIVCEVKSPFFVMENVERIKKSTILANIIQQFQDEGYGLTAAILNASHCGVPQSRTRFFLFGHLGGVDNALLPYLYDNLSEKKMTVRDYLGDSLGIQHYYRHPRNYSRRGVFSIDEPSPTIRGVNRPIPPGYVKHRGDSDKTNWDELRPLTTIERSYLQTFPKKFIFKGTKTNLEQMIGNAVPVNLANYLAQAILRYRNSGFNISPNLPPFEIPKSILKPQISICKSEQLSLLNAV